MKRQILLILLSMVVCCHEFLTARQSRQDSLIAAGKAFVEMVARGEPLSTAAYFDSTINALMPAPKLHETWGQVVGQCGAYKQEMGAVSLRYGSFEIVSVTCEFERDTLDVRLSYNSAGKIAGLFFAKHQPPPQFSPPSYAKREMFREEDVVVGSGMWALPGTLTMPTARQEAPAVVLVHGSGPNDRDETMGSNKPFRDLAWGLASKGVAVLRYEKRTREHGAQLLSLRYPLTVKEESIDDALSAVSLLRRTKGIDTSRIYVLGHSLGGMLAPRIGKLDPHLAGLIILAGTTRPLEDVIIEQLTYLLSLRENASDQEKKQVELSKEQRDRIKNLKMSDTTMTEMIFAAPAKYWLDLRGYNPAALAKTLSMPMLILQGERDYQVTLKDFEGWKTALQYQKNVTFKLYPKLNHLFLEGEGRSAPAAYERAGHIPEEVIDDIAGWVKK